MMNGMSLFFFFTEPATTEISTLSLHDALPICMSPVLVALGAQVFAGETLPPAAWAGILVASAGIFLMAGDVFRGKTPPLVVLTALATGGMIASYSLIDGIGVRLSDSAIGYIGWLFIA